MLLPRCITVEDPFAEVYYFSRCTIRDPVSEVYRAGMLIWAGRYKVLGSGGGGTFNRGKA